MLIYIIYLQRVLRNIKKGVAEQIDILSTKMFKENGYTPPKKDNINDEDENHEQDSKVLQTLKRNVSMTVVGYNLKYIYPAVH